ncbi:MAG: glucose-1-phosphate thymidylyltransferase [bacterium]
MKGLVLAGGCGTRLRPITYSGAKQLVPVANKPILFYVIESLARASVRDIGVIISPETGLEIQQALGDGTKWGVKFTFIRQEQPAGLAHAVLVAKPFLGDSDFCMYLGDNLIGTSIVAPVQEFVWQKGVDAAVMLKEVSNPASYGVAVLNKDGGIVQLIEKPKERISNLALVGIYLFRARIFEAIDRIKPSKRGELEITDAIEELIEMGGKVGYSMVTSWWLDTGKKDDLLLANDTVLDSLLESGSAGAHIDEKSKLWGRVRVGNGAIIQNSTIRGPVIIGLGASICNSRIDPFTSIGDRACVVESTVSHSVIMEDSRIVGVPRLEDALVGRRVVIKDTLAHSGLSLTVGDDTVITCGRR